MVPSLLFAAALSQVADNPSVTAIEVSVTPGTQVWVTDPGGTLKHPVLIWGDPPHLRGYPWNGLHPNVVEPRLTMSVKSPQKQKLVALAPVTPADPVAERIKALEWGITALRVRGGSQEAIDQLQRELDALKK